MSIKSKFSPLGYLFPKTPQVQLTITCNISVDNIYLNGVSIAQNTDTVTLSVNKGLICDIYATKDGYNDSLHQNFIIYENKSTTLNLIISELDTLYLTINSGDDGKFIIPFNQYRQVAYDWKVDWGDGTGWKTYSGTGAYNTGIEYNNYETNHNYTIKIKNNGTRRGWLQAFGFDVTITDTDISASSLHNKDKVLIVDGQLNADMFTEAMSLQNYTFAYMFQDCHNLQIGENFTFFNCKQINDYVCQFMFQNCTSLNNLKNMSLSFLNLNEIGNNFCYGMFQNCTSLTNLGNFNLPQRSNIHSIGNNFCYGMFQNCSSLENLGNLTVTNIKNCGNYAFAYMFKDCISLNDLSDFNLPQGLTNAPQIGFAYRMFYNCAALENLGNMKIPNITSINNNTYSVVLSGNTLIPPLNNIPIKISYFEETFYNCTALKTGIISFLSNWTNATQVMVNYHWVYRSHWSLEAPGAGPARDMPVLYRVFRKMFAYCSSIEEILTPAINVLSFTPTLNPIGTDGTGIITETRQTFVGCPLSLITTISDNWK